MEEKKKPNEVLVRAFVDINDFMAEVSDEDLAKVVSERKINTIGEIGVSELCKEIKKRIADNDIMEEEVIDMIGIDVSEYEAAPSTTGLKEGFDSLQHQQLYEEFEAARKHHNPMKLFEIFDKLNRPQINTKMIVLQ